MKKATDKKRRAFFALILAAACAAAGTLSGCGAASASGAGSTVVRASAAEAAPAAQTETSSDTITVSAKGSVYAEPDLAELRFGVRTQGAAAADAQAENSRTVDSVVKVLKENSIKEENIQTTWYDVSPQYDWNTGNGDTITGFSVSTTLSVKGVAIAEAGKLISACTEAGANEFNGITYSCSEYQVLYTQAQQKAVEAAREKADALANAAGRSLGSIKTIAEGWQDTSYEPNLKTVSAGGMGGAAEDSSSASLMPGTAEITANVTVTYELK
ncbi:MAG: SIMPL domain-containing protein [Eubacteriales bacterium]|nr:SIMPL domain-containing protein [Eubacteriales bacterium]